MSKEEKTKKKREKPEDFIGWRSDGGLLEVIGVYGKQGTHATFKVICHKCKEDKELFPDGYFISTKSNLVNNQKPCGCSKRPQWTKEQFLILARRAGKDKFIVHGFSEEYKNQKTKLNLECLVDGHKWTASANNVINIGSGCPKCKGKTLADAKRTDEQETLGKCRAICEAEGYEPLCFPSGYKNAFSRFEYKCPIHDIQNVRYHNFVNGGRRCNGCWKERQKEIGNGYGYYPDRKDEQDFLYVLSFNGKFVKIGRSFDVDERMKGLRTESKVPIKKIHKLRIFTATHQEIYDLEQELHSELRDRNFQYYVKWSKECFDNDCLFILNKMLDVCGLEGLI